MAGVPHTEQNHLHRQRREFHIRNNDQKTKENDVRIILSSLAYITPIRLSFCISTGEREGGRGRERGERGGRGREKFSLKKKSKSVRNDFTVE